PSSLVPRHRLLNRGWIRGSRQIGPLLIRRRSFLAAHADASGPKHEQQTPREFTSPRADQQKCRPFLRAAWIKIVRHINFIGASFECIERLASSDNRFASLTCEISILTLDTGRLHRCLRQSPFNKPPNYIASKLAKCE